MIELKNVSSGYGGSIVLHDVSLRLEKGCLTSIIGTNGCGKSTLFKTILAMLPLGGGEIDIDGVSLGNMNRNEIARKLSYLAQGKNTPDMSVSQMVLHGRFPHLSYPRRYSKNDYEIASAAMEQMGIAEYAHSSMQELSGGLRQNAYIAMALAQGTDYMLLDEPTTYLDIAHQLALMKKLRKLAEEGKGIAAVMHDLPLAMSFSDKIVFIDKGSVIFSGNASELSRQGLTEKIFGIAVEPNPDGKSFSYRY